MNRIALFLGVCIVLRSVLAYAAYRLPSTTVYYMAFPALVIGASMILLFLTGWRKTGVEVNNERIWWNPIRPVHGMLYLAFAYLALMQHPLAYVPLVIDVVFGLTAFTVFHLFFT